MNKTKKAPLLLLLPLFGLLACHADPNSSGKTPLPPNARFESIPPAKSGVHFSNNIHESFRQNIVTNSYLFNGGGVAILDVNNDELPDLYFVSSQESNRLYLNRGNFRFEDITEVAGVAALGGIKTGVTVVDIDNDGFQDLYVCRSGIDTMPAELPKRANLLFINNGNLSFSEKAAEIGLDDVSASNHANFFDYDLDGDLDLYLLNHPVDFHSVNKILVVQTDSGYVRKTNPNHRFESDKLYRNNGDGTFTDVSQTAGIQNRAFGLSVTVADFNGDHFPDIFVGNDYIEPDLLYINNQNGTFTNRLDQFFRHTSNHTMGVDIADFNNDGLVDLVALDMIAEDNKRRKELMTTMLLNRYLSLLKYHYGRQLMRNTLQLNNGTGDFSEIGTIAGISNTDWSWSCLLADFDNDSYKDLYITNGYRRDVTNLDYLTFTVDSINRRGGISKRNFPKIEDYLNLIPSQKLQNYLFRNRGDLTFEKISNQWGLIQKSFSNGAAYADLDADGDLDLVVNNIADAAFLFKNKTAERKGANYLQIKLEGSPKNRGGTGASVKIFYAGKMQLQELNPTRGYFSSVEYLLHFGLKNQKEIDRLEIRWPDNKIQILEHIPVNQRLRLKYSDAKMSNQSPPRKASPIFQTAAIRGLKFRHRENDFLDFQRERLLPHKLSELGPSLAVGDVNGDGLEDFFIGGAADNSAALFLQNPNSTFQKTSEKTWNADLAFEDLGAVFFDSDGDGDLDLYVVSGGNAFPANSDRYQDRLYLNDGKGNFSKTKKALPRITSSGSCVRVADYDSDGDLDLFVGGRVRPGAYPDPPQSYVLKNEGGAFVDATQQVAPAFRSLGMVTDILWADLDGDAKPEMIVAGEWLPISIFKNENGKLVNRTDSFGLSETSGWWNCLIAKDFDKDGDMDLVAGNLGLNTRFKASKKEPLRLFAKDFDRNGNLDPVLAFYENDRLYPLPQRDVLLQQIPSLKKKFARHAAYAKADMETIFSPSELASALQLEAKIFATTYFENRGNGTFAIKPLSNEAQLSPTNKILAADFTDDGNLDFLLAGNNYSADVESGPFDAGNGLLLLGDGKGNFVPVLSRDSGFSATKAATDLAALKLANGKELILVANNNDALQAFIKER